jgi:hypothetical protein
MIDRAHDLPITQQAAALNISRGRIYYLPRAVPEADLAIMRRLDLLRCAVTRCRKSSHRTGADPLPIESDQA